MRALVLAAALSLGACHQWSPMNTVAESAFAVEIAIDASQTRFITKDCNEINPIVGKCGQRVPFYVYLPLAFLTHWAIAAALPPSWRPWFQAVTAGVEGTVVYDNADFGYYPWGRRK